ncbi:MAG: hypothetical protein ACREQF_12540, partial [Candidatus Binataceae bacterium]
MKLAFIVQRYGTEILGGAEYACRLLAERVVQRHEVEVLTTCARDYITWKNEYPEGSDRVRGVTVRRFANARTRDISAFDRYSDWIYHHPHDRSDEMEWLKQQGPWCPALIEYLTRHHRQYDALVFFTYLYAPTVLGLSIDPSRSILVPAAHDEPPIHLGIYRELFSLPAGIAYYTEAERKFLTTHFSLRALAEETIGCGVDLAPQGGRHAEERLLEASDKAATEDDGPSATRVWSPLSARGATFRRRHRLHGQFVLYGGRIDPGKGCEELIEYFSSYVD